MRIANKRARGGPTAQPRRYVGRFAPSPSGDLHLGSLYTAVASYLEARVNRGRWLLRIEDLDRPREVPGAADRIRATLEAFGFEWDGEVVRQHDRQDLYRSALDDLRARGLLFDCACSRRLRSDADRYPGTCRDARRPAGLETAVRLRVDPRTILFADRIQGRFRQDVAAAVGDFIVERRDRIIAYVLAVVVDDAAQGVTEVVRGADLLDDTPRQIYLQGVLGLATPHYAHVPLLVEPDGGKLAKSERSVPLNEDSAAEQLCRVFDLLGLPAPAGLRAGTVADAWAWAIGRWDIGKVPKRLSLPLSARETV